MRHGFDHAFYALGGGMDYFHHVEDPPAYAPVLRLNGRPEKRRGYATDLFVEEADRWVRAQVARAPRAAVLPLFCRSPCRTRRSRLPDEEQPAPLPAGSPRWNQGKAPPEIYAAMIERMDTVIGQLLATVDELRLAPNTLVIFTSDNGGTRSARPSGLREYKGTTFEGGIRVPPSCAGPACCRPGGRFPNPR
jgi:hypothetical protein